MQTIFESPYTRVTLDESRSEMCYYSTPQTADLPDDEAYQADALASAMAMKDYQVQFIITDTRDNNYPLSPDLQDWVNINISPLWHQTGVKKVGVILPQEFIASLGMTQTIEDDRAGGSVAGKPVIQYFEDYESARAWFASA
ncbi:hypothetical protein [Eisenibacter elegans]|uniref:hypothetical protein n=1 Tax=Eisenibacter elegans TaxID=997 RepID=UPI0003F5C833|nr:hypothetical protein [Eisenibacter elegans]